MIMNDELSFDEISHYIIEILSGERISSILYCKEPVKLLQPTYYHKLYSKYLEQQALNKYLDEGYKSEEDLSLDILFVDSFFSVQDQEELEEVQSKIIAYNKILRKKDKKLPSYKEDVIKLDELKTRELGLLNKKNSIKYFSAEFKAREDKFLYILSECVLTLNNQKIFYELDKVDYTNYSLDDLYSDLNTYLTFYYGLESNVVRQIARSNQWRSYVIGCNKNIISLFNKASGDLSIDQLNLMSWTNYYLNIDEMPLKDRPTDETIKDDNKLDLYLEEYTKKIKAEIEVSKINRNNDKADHTVVTAESPNYIKYHKDQLYSDTEIISGKGNKNSTEYLESKEYKKIKQKLSSI